MAQTAIAARRLQAIGSMTELVSGVVLVAAGNTTTLTLPQFSVVQGVVCVGSTADEVVTVSGIVGNVITFDNEGGSSTNTAYLAWGLGFN